MMSPDAIPNTSWSPSPPDRGLHDQGGALVEPGQLFVTLGPDIRQEKEDVALVPNLQRLEVEQRLGLADRIGTEGAEGPGRSVPETGILSYTVGSTFVLSRKRFVGSQRFFTSTSRRWFR